MISTLMKIYEVTKTPSADKLRIDALKRQKEQVTKQLQATKARAKIQSGEQALQKAMS
jgi:hypothetical protein